MGGGSPRGSQQRVRFCRSIDGTTIAYAVHGAGPPLVLDSCWLSHLEFDWQSPVWRHYLVELGRDHTVVRFDERGHGLSQRDVTDFSLERRIDDLTQVVDDLGLGRFALMAMAQGGPVALHYTVRHPERVSHLVCASTYAGVGNHVTDDDRELEAAFEAMIRAGWDRKDPLFRRVFTTMMIPGATEQQMRWVDDLQQRAVSARTAYAARRQRGEADALDVLAQVTAPTLILHSRHERMNAFEHSPARARHPGRPAGRPRQRQPHPAGGRARVAGLHHRGSCLPCHARRRRATGHRGWPGRGRPLDEVLSRREAEVLGLAAQGLTNGAIATALTLSVRTVERHLQNVYTKLGVGGPTARAVAVVRWVRDR
ncbi:alpha/beta fold hydrolase [Arsenicicoccus piscis]|uniref:HTH luxR-type domain-containing protein n=1 Tax=Arsenicicoccus piscis TaxID=673954 RepID=A0ABQ6HI96_9MICO|nr:alpha/beta fold hydrolase [Arsenicicoccus piscis]GMA17992.1 hypothetical protein GCM10025862_00130 [Arsenicicoccus piscis]